MIRAIIFDFDKMVHLTEDLFSKWVTRKYDLSQDKVTEFFTKEYPLCRIGKLDTKEVLKEKLPEFKWKNSVEDFIKCWSEYGSIDDRIIELIDRLRRKNIICVLVTNNEKYRMEYCKEKYRLNEIFDHILIAAELGYLKPDQQMLDKIVEVTKLERGEILFCDDKNSSIEAAENFGFRTFHYSNYEGFELFLKKNNLI